MAGELSKKCTYCGGPVDVGGAGLDPATPPADECTYCGAAVDEGMRYRPTNPTPQKASYS